MSMKSMQQIVKPGWMLVLLGVMGIAPLAEASAPAVIQLRDGKEIRATSVYYRRSSKSYVVRRKGVEQLIPTRNVASIKAKPYGLASLGLDPRESHRPAAKRRRPLAPAPPSAPPGAGAAGGAPRLPAHSRAHQG